MSWATSPHGVAAAYDLDLDELLAMADYLEVDLQHAQQHRGILAAVAQAAVFPLAGQWSMHIAQGGKMCAWPHHAPPRFSYCATLAVLQRHSLTLRWQVLARQRERHLNMDPP